MSDNPKTSRSRSALSWYREGAKQIVSVPAFILMISFIGFGALTREAGLTVFDAMVLGLATWALPSAVVVVGAILAELPFYTTVFAVCLASIRLMPMTMALAPILKGSKVKTWHLLVASNFVAVTAWVYAMNRLPELEDRNARLPFFLGFGLTLAIVNTVIIGLSHTLVTTLPEIMAAGLLFLMPIYFLVSMTQAAKVPAEYLAIGLGLILGPTFHYLNPQTGLLLCGLIGGTLAYLIARVIRVARGEV